MNDQSDPQLLRAYAEHRSEPAFTELVRRHVDFVYSAALRMVCDSHLAEDVTQGVFVALTKNVTQLMDRPVLSGWLHRSAQNIAAQTVRTDVRRRVREQEAAAMKELLDAEPDTVWELIAPQLDEALGELNEGDRDALLLRYFERKSAREMAQTLGTSEDAAQKRVGRAVERLREILVKRGVTIGASGLGVVITANAVQAAPAGLAITISTAAALAGTTMAAATIATHAPMNWINAKVISAVVASVLVAGIAVHLAQQRETDRLRSENQKLRVQQEGLTKERDDVVSAAATRNDEVDRLKEGQNELLRLRAEVRRLRAQQNEPAVAAASATTQVETAFAEFQGQVVDDQTDKPVTDFALQQGATYPEKPDEIVWGFGLETSSRRPQGRFQSRGGWATGRKVWLRVIADGFLPQPVTEEPVVVPATRTNLLVRLKRGGSLQGIVLEHIGKPVAGARVFLAGAQPLDLSDGRPEMFKGSTVTTDTEGRFTLTGVSGAEEKVVVTSAAVQVWLSPKPEPGQDLTILLPEPVTLTVRYDIAGDAPQGKLRLELKTWETPEWNGITCVLRPTMTNQGQIMLTNLAPGTYDLARDKALRIGDMGRGVLCDRTTVELRSGQAQSVNFVRTAGYSVGGEITGLADVGVAGAFIYVRPAGASGDPRKMEEAKLPLYDAVACGQDGQFQTARLAPGAYTIVAEAYRAETPEERGHTGWRLPSHIGMAQVTVSADAAPVPVRIELRSR